MREGKDQAQEEESEEGQRQPEGTLMRISIRSALCAAFALVAIMVCNASASAAVTEGTGWEAYSNAYPTNLHPGGQGLITVDFMNIGAKPSSGSITITDALPAGVTATKVGGMTPNSAGPYTREEEEDGSVYAVNGARWDCTGNGSSGENDIVGATVFTCTSNPAYLEAIPHYTIGFRDEIIERIGIDVEVEHGAAQREHADCTTEPTFCNRIALAGGGASSTTTVADPLTVSSSEAAFGFSGMDQWFSNPDGTIDTQAGSHPYASTFYVGFNASASEGGTGGDPAGGEIRDLNFVVPPGLFANSSAVPDCTRSQLSGLTCPAQTQVGDVNSELRSEAGPGAAPLLAKFPLYNIVPPAGAPAMFAFSIIGYNVFFIAGVGAGHGYAIVQHLENIAPAKITGSIVTVWGVPAAEGHNAERVSENVEDHNKKCSSEGCPAGTSEKPYLTLPTACAGPQVLTAEALATWTDPNARAEMTSVTHDASGTPVGFTGCENLSIEPLFSAAPDTSFADTPAGLGVNVEVPQPSLNVPEGLVQSTLKDTKVTLPEGIAINPGQAAGLAACGEAEANIHGEGPQTCPSASKVGTASLKSPLLEGEVETELTGNVYVLQSDPPHLKLLVAVSGDGVYVKLPGNVELNEATGQLTTTFDETPALPFTDFKLNFSGGAQAALATPTHCGTYTTTSDFSPWTTPFGGDLFPTSSFLITSGSDGTPCPPTPLPFTPALIAGSTTDQAGGFTDFSLLLQAPDDQQRVERLQFKTPEGLLGMISKVPLCPEAQANAGTCPEASQIGHTVVQSGPGPYPLVVPQPGQPPAPIYLTGGYEGAPYGLSIVVPLHVGPFVLQTQVVRAKIEVDPLTSQLTVTTGPLPQHIDGIPTDLRTIDAVVDRPEFMFNPTGCSPRAFSGTAYGTEGGQGALESHFQMGSCRALLFQPDFKVSTSGKTSKGDGASLGVKLVYPTGNLGANQASAQSNIQSVKVELPKQLPSRLTTLQKACTAAQFNANPAGCPPDSVVCMAKAVTPVLPVPLTGPAYFVSNGGEAFPNLIVVLQGYGVTIHLVGDTFISKAGITSSTFKSVPDVPIGSFELNLPEGPFSALAASGNLCKEKLAMPTEFIAQSGAEIHESTPITVTGCKPSITVTHHAVSGRKATIAVSVPSAGTLTAGGAGLSHATTTAGSAGTVTVKLTLSAGEQRFLRRHPGRRLKVNVKLRFTPKQGGGLTSDVTLLMR
jgi:hypothetical protein